MGLCDQLEVARTARERTRDRLTTASLIRLSAPDTDAATFRSHARFAVDALPALTPRADQVKHLRQAILNLAVRGRLVEQEWEEDRGNQGQLRSDAVAETFDARAFEGRAALFNIPVNWAIEPLSRVASHIVDCLHTTPKWTDDGVLCIKTNQVRAGQLDLSSPHFVSENTYKVRVNRLEPRQDDVLYIREGGILGVACLVPSNTRLCLGQRLMHIRTNNAVVPQFLELCLNSPWITEFAIEKTTGGAAPRVNMSIVRGYPIPLPPLAEQHRIVAKVDELMALCDCMEADFAAADGTRSRLLKSLLHDALAFAAHEPDDRQEVRDMKHSGPGGDGGETPQSGSRVQRCAPRPAQPGWCREDNGMTRVPVPPEMLHWACERAGYDMAYVAERMPQLPAWVRRERQPTLKQLEKLAKITHTPLGYLFLPEPPDERLPVP